jgi:hypothetical protein
MKTIKDDRSDHSDRDRLDEVIDLVVSALEKFAPSLAEDSVELPEEVEMIDAVVALAAIAGRLLSGCPDLDTRGKLIKRCVQLLCEQAGFGFEDTTRAQEQVTTH